jgi:hypothetical protein
MIYSCIRGRGAIRGRFIRVPVVAGLWQPFVVLFVDGS